MERHSDGRSRGGEGAGAGGTALGCLKARSVRVRPSLGSSRGCLLHDISEHDCFYLDASAPSHDVITTDPSPVRDILPQTPTSPWSASTYCHGCFSLWFDFYTIISNLGCRLVFWMATRFSEKSRPMTYWPFPTPNTASAVSMVVHPGISMLSITSLTSLS
jgi:hypothetical protein